jgi:hypothetical protein
MERDVQLTRQEVAMDRRAITCPVTAHLEAIDYERTSLGVIVERCTRFPAGDVQCSCECARRIDRHDRADCGDPTERVLVVYAGERAPADVVAHALRADDFTVELADASVAGSPPPEDYDAVVLVVRAGWLHHGRAISDYARDHDNGLRARLTRTFAVPRRWARKSIEQRANAFARLLADDIPSSASAHDSPYV